MVGKLVRFSDHFKMESYGPDRISSGNYPEWAKCFGHIEGFEDKHNKIAQVQWSNGQFTRVHIGNLEFII
jgi:hypothetical protein